MNKKDHMVIWVSEITEFQEHGERLTKEVATDAVEYANKRHPSIRHEAVFVGIENKVSEN